MSDRTAWEATREDMDSMAAELAADGWETLSITAGDTAPVGPDVGSDDRFGLFHVVQGDDADRLEDCLERAALSRSEAYLAVRGGTEYVVTVLRDPDQEIAVLIAGAFDSGQAAACFDAAVDAGKTYTHVQRLDGSHVTTFEHDDPTLFDPESA